MAGAKGTSKFFGKNAIVKHPARVCEAAVPPVGFPIFHEDISI